MEGQVLYKGQNRTLTGDWKKVASHDYQSFLSPHSFEWFATFTFKDHKHPEAADKSFRHWCNLTNKDIYGKRWKDRYPYGIKWVRALEYQKRDVIHYHALISGVKDTHYALAHLAARQWTCKMECGFARITCISKEDNQIAVKRYLAKYVTKDGELDFSTNFANETALDLANGKILKPRFSALSKPSREPVS